MIRLKNTIWNRLKRLLHINFNDREEEKEAQKRKMWEAAVRRHGYKDLDDYNARHEEVERKAYEEWMKLPFEERCKQSGIL